MKFESLFKYVEEGFPLNGTQTSRGPEGGGAGVGNGDQTTNTGLTPQQYRPGAGEYEEERPKSLDANKLKSCIETLKTFQRTGMGPNDITNLIHKLADVEASMKQINSFDEQAINTPPGVAFSYRV